MNIEDAQNKSIQKYINNMDFLSNNNRQLFDKIKLFESAIELEEVIEEYDLEYKNNYFDIYSNKKKEYLYNCNSINYSKNIIKSINFNSKESSFKTFYNVEFEDGVSSRAINSSILSNAIFSTSPIIDYVNINIPEKENLDKIYNYIIFGVGVGLHIPLIHKKMQAKVYHIIEPSLEIFRLSLFVIDYSLIAKDSTILFYVAENKDEFSKRFSTGYYKTFFYNQYIKFFIFSTNCEIYISSIQDILVRQPQYLYSYERELLSLKRSYEYLKKGYRYIDISHKHECKELNDKPILFLAAGPSLRHKIDFLKKNQTKYIIVTVYGTIKFLEEHNIVPDMILQFDQGERAIETLQSLSNIDFLSNTIFLFASHISSQLLDKLDNDNIYMFQATNRVKINFGTITAPSIGEITYFLILLFGFKNIYLLGIDMALDPETKQTHYSKEYLGTFSTDEVEENSLEKYDFRKTLIKVKGNFLNQVDTFPAYKISIEHMNKFTEIFATSDIEVYNLSNGAYFEDIKPLKIDDIDVKVFDYIQKDLLKEQFHIFFNNISENVLNEEDFIYNKNKLEDAKKIKEKLVILFENKFTSFVELENAIFALQKELTLKYVCSDLQVIMNSFLNRTINYIFYLFNIQSLANPKRHIKKLQKVLFIQLEKVVSEYINMIEENVIKKT